jgi:hypothetical protein
MERTVTPDAAISDKVAYEKLLVIPGHTGCSSAEQQAVANHS